MEQSLSRAPSRLEALLPQGLLSTRNIRSEWLLQAEWRARDGWSVRSLRKDQSISPYPLELDPSQFPTPLQ